MADFCGGSYNFPDLTNQCSSAMGAMKQVTDWVSDVDSSHTGTVEGNQTIAFTNNFSDACKLISDEWEWIGFSAASTYLPVQTSDYVASANPVNPGLPVQVPESTAEGNSCFEGLGYIKDPYGNLWCQRTKFSGDPLSCCLKNYNCSGVCYSDTNDPNSETAKLTCAPDFRDLYGSPCEPYLVDFCSGKSPSTYYTQAGSFTDLWMNEWSETGTCMTYLKNKLFEVGDTCNPAAIVPDSGSDPSNCDYTYNLEYNNDGLYVANLLVQGALSTFQEKYTLGAPIGSSGYNSFDSYLFTNVCCKYPGVCDSGLRSQCSKFSENDLTRNQRLSLWCGCNLSDQYYNTYGAGYNLPKECTPTCSKKGVIHNGDISTNRIKTCESNVCMIDNTTVNLIDTTVGAIDFDQVCSTCTGSNCSCIINGNTFNIADSTINGVFIPINDGCNNLTCNSKSTASTGPSSLGNNCVDTETGLETYYSKFESLFQIYNYQSLLLNVGIGLLILFFAFVIIVLSIPLFSYFRKTRK